MTWGDFTRGTGGRFTGSKGGGGNGGSGGGVVGGIRGIRARLRLKVAEKKLAATKAQLGEAKSAAVAKMIAKREKIVAAHKREAQRIAKRGKVETAVKPARSVEHRTARLNARAMRLKQARADAKTQRDAEGKGSKEAMLATRVSRNRANELARQRAKDGNTTRHDEGRFLTARKRLHETKRSLQKEGANLKLRSKELTKERDRLSARVEQVRHHELHHSHAEKVYGRSLPKTASHQRALAGHARALERVREAEGRAAAKRVAFHERILEKRRLQLKATHARNGTNSDHLREMGIHV